MKFVIIALTAALAVSCRRDDGGSVWWENQKTITELRQELELARYKAESLDQGAPETPSEADAPDPERLREELGSMALRKERISGEIAALNGGWEKFRAETLHRRRAEAIRDFPGEYTMGDGSVLKEARVTRIDDGGVSLTHSTGVARLRIGDLDASGQAYFGMDPELAGIAEGEERRQRIAYDRWLRETLAANAAKQEKLDEKRRAEEKRLADARVLAAASAVPRTSPLSASIGALGETSASGRSRYYPRRHTYSDRPSVRYRYFYVRPSPCSGGTPFWSRPSPVRPACSPFAPVSPYRP